ncbi:hypothetical protein DFH94DRAFT_285834 [Russula ochroleuca]|uniref:Uncharacterized protein n=1 Tax=Russula ochroleuca TaxID=152965 RepID=A0A9P5MLL7_9AGAM|nr:hypothetical protein DFH94DRAFT_285834 [Russula ochroleuca]
MSASDRTPPSTTTHSPSPPPMLPAKRKASEEPDAPHDSISSSSKDFEAGRVTCEACGDAVSYRDERTGAFTTKHWDAHKLGCPAASSASPASEPPQSQARPLNATGASTEPKAKTNTSSSVPVPPSKRRRAKRSEEERIQYLRSDPYVAQFDAYRVLCASCNKWIRLRPNSTFCSIPWDAHRKSCLARKGAKEVAPPFVAADPDALKYDGGRVLCKACNGWIFVGQDSQAAQTWSQHRTQCRPASPSAPPAATTIPSVPPPSQHQLALVSSHLSPASRTAKEKEKDRPPQSPLAPAPLSSSPQPPSAVSLPDLPLSTSAPSTSGSESRRRNAEQRAAQLRADPLLAQVEPHRVFCALCRKWVQLRQDSTFCAYPWQQHRNKCVIRHEKKTTKVKAMEGVMTTHSGHATPAGAASGDESNDNFELCAEGPGEEMDTSTAAVEDAVMVGAESDAATDNLAARFADLNSPADRYVYSLPPPLFTIAATRLLFIVLSLTSLSRYIARHFPSRASIAIAFWVAMIFFFLLPSLLPRTYIFGDGYLVQRLDFTRNSVAYLFRTTYAPADSLTIAALVAYMNAALPPDKHEEFDTAEVTRAAKTLHDRGSVVFEGDTLKPLH